jgi:hypothetical protein
VSNELVPYDDLQRMAKQVVESRLFPVKSESEAITLFLLCQAEGLHPMRALRMFDIIQGRPAIKPKALLASLGERGGHVEWMQNDDQACIGKFYGKACPEGVVVKFDVEDAKKAGLLNKPGPWQQYRADMLRHRCTGRGVDMADPGAAFGLYSTPVVQDFEPTKAPAEFEVVGDVPKAGSVEVPQPEVAPTTVQSAEGLTTEEYLEQAKARRQAALDRLKPPPEDPDDPGPQPDFTQALQASIEQVRAKVGRPKNVPEWCECGKAILKHESTDGSNEYWECALRRSERHKMKEQGEADSNIREALKGHFFKWAGRAAAAAKEGKGPPPTPAATPASDALPF